MTMHLPIRTQIKPSKDPIVHWGVHFLYEDVVSDYGSGDEAKAAAEASVKEWATTDYPAMLVSSVILPWTPDSKQKLSLVMAIQQASSSATATVALRQWLVEQKYDEFKNLSVEPKTRLKQQVPLVNEMRRADVTRAFALLNEWLISHSYESQQ